ncbi:hypothetical protein AcW1_005808 [Taiwanofungus camphoratus]|nr:hypothetical protein AcW2_004567 [Antrodia cinnamomea]KAI0934205.1 hypothetical protein AcV5_006130 [Antrodia cinnamomea]KAI0950496.1 hypothetical protein AcV7_008942 [Antrodia cinnamomea]KAI0957403.1 hypothetical protein AcW1_005808 [Antrodia cinnamomea]
MSLLVTMHNRRSGSLSSSLLIVIILWFERRSCTIHYRPVWRRQHGRSDTLTLLFCVWKQYTILVPWSWAEKDPKMGMLPAWRPCGCKKTGHAKVTPATWDPTTHKQHALQTSLCEIAQRHLLRRNGAEVEVEETIVRIRKQAGALWTLSHRAQMWQ